MSHYTGYFNPNYSLVYLHVVFLGKARHLHFISPLVFDLVSAVNLGRFLVVIVSGVSSVLSLSPGLPAIKALAASLLTVLLRALLSCSVVSTSLRPRGLCHSGVFDCL